MIDRETPPPLPKKYGWLCTAKAREDGAVQHAVRETSEWMASALCGLRRPSNNGWAMDFFSGQYCELCVKRSEELKKPTNTQRMWLERLAAGAVIFFRSQRNIFGYSRIAAPREHLGFVGPKVFAALKREGWVSGQREQMSIVYRITDKGRRALNV